MRKLYIALFLLALGLPMQASAAAPEARQSWSQSPPPINEENPQAAILEAEKRFEAAEKDFTRAENAEAAAAFGKNQPASQQTQPEAAKNSTQQTQQPQRDPREQALQGSPETGYSGTWTDPATGDIITSVIAPTPQPSYNQSQQYPIIIEPQVAAGSWSGTSAGNWNGGWNGGGWTGGSSDWSPDWQPQWKPDWNPDQGWQPSFPGNPGSMPPPPPPANRPNHWAAPVYPTHGPINPVPPFPPGYRPLRPGQQSWQGNQGYQPPANGLNPPGTANIPGYNSPPWGNGRPLGYNPLIPPANNQPGGNFPVGPANPGLQPPAGPMPNGPAPGMRSQPRGGF